MIDVRKQQQRINYLGRFQQRTSLRVVIEKIGNASAVVRGDLSKETLKELLMSELSLASKTKSFEKEDIKTSRNNFQEDINQDATKDNKKEILIDSDEISEDIIRKIEDQCTDLSENGKEQVDEEKNREKCDEQISKNSELDGEIETFETKLTDVREQGNGEKYKKNIYVQKSKFHNKDFGAVKSSQEILNELLTEEDSVSEMKEDTFNLSEDSKWLRKYFKQPLILVMKEIIERKPSDPVNYLGFWLFNYRSAQENRETKTHLEKELLKTGEDQNNLQNGMQNIFKPILEKEDEVSIEGEESIEN